MYSVFLSSHFFSCTNVPEHAQGKTFMVLEMEDSQQRHRGMLQKIN